jgi:hypothetical protein
VPEAGGSMTITGGCCDKGGDGGALPVSGSPDDEVESW